MVGGLIPYVFIYDFVIGLAKRLGRLKVRSIRKIEGDS